jgi:UDP-GlcNAc:undecaprenyl-phosphate/decaprenyl-phosphate GlcNAc-1-phosphate transferase
MILIPPLMQFAARLGFVDIPDARKVHTGAIPRIGGVAMVVGTLFATLLWLELSRQTLSILAGISIIAAFGIWDDRTDLNYRLKLLGQLIAACVVVFYGDVLIERTPFNLNLLPIYISAPITIFVLLGVTNAINLSDGLDGLAGGVALLSFLAIGILGYRAGSDELVIICLAVIGGIMGFLRFNTHPARIFMGDTGSQYLGFCVGVLAIVLTQTVNPKLSSAMPLLILGLPVLDTLMVMGLRIHQKRSPFSPDKSHIHHRLLAMGFDQYESVLIIYLLQSTLVLLGFALRYRPDWLVLGVYLTICAGVLFFFRWAWTSGWRFKSRSVGESGKFLTNRIKWVQARGGMERLSVQMVLIFTLVYMAFSLLRTPRVTSDIMILCLVMLAVHLTFLITRRDLPFTSAERGGLYVMSVLAIYLMQPLVHTPSLNRTLDNAFFIVLAGMIFLGIHHAQKNKFEITTLDFLVIFMAIALPALSGLLAQHAGYAVVMLKVIVLFYAIELVLNRMTRGWMLLRVGLSLLLALLAARTLI